MSERILRRYALSECDGEGYPIPWHMPETLTMKDGGGNIVREFISVPAIKDYIRELAGHRCVRCGHPYPPGISQSHPRGEWTPCDDECDHGGPFHIRAHGEFPWTEYDGGGEAQTLRQGEPPLEVEAQWRILTVHHLDGDKSNCLWWNLAALCQRCHLTIQGRVVMERAFILEHSDWFKPYAAGFYAVKYLDEDLTREETMARLDELLGFELLA